MNTKQVTRELELAMYEMAEADTLLNRANLLKRKAAQRIASVHAEIKLAESQALHKKNNPPKPTFTR